MDDRRKDLLDLLMALTITAVSLYPLYRDDLHRAVMWVQDKFSYRDDAAAALKQVQREISWMEHPSGS